MIEILLTPAIVVCLYEPVVPVRIAAVDLLVSQIVHALNVPTSALVPMGIAE